MKKGTIVKLKTFNRISIAKKDVDPINNYWQLIGEKGEVISGEFFNNRVLVLFDKDLDQFKIANHNPIKNSLWILPDDLEVINN